MPDSGDNSESVYGGQPSTSKQKRPRIEPVPALDAAEQVTVQIDLLQEQHDAIQRIIAANGWKQDEGLLTVLMSGLGYLDATLQVEGIGNSHAGEDEARRVNNLVQDLATYHSMYGVMKYQAFKMYKINQTLEFNVAGLRATERMWEEWGERMRREQADLRAEVLRLRSVMAEFRVDVPSVSAPGERTQQPISSVIPSLMRPLPAQQFDSWEKKPELADAQQPVSEAEPRPSFWSRLFRRKR